MGLLRLSLGGSEGILLGQVSAVSPHGGGNGGGGSHESISLGYQGSGGICSLEGSGVIGFAGRQSGDVNKRGNGCSSVLSMDKGGTIGCDQSSVLLKLSGGSGISSLDQGGTIGITNGNGSVGSHSHSHLDIAGNGGGGIYFALGIFCNSIDGGGASGGTGGIHRNLTSVLAGSGSVGHLKNNEGNQTVGLISISNGNGSGGSHSHLDIEGNGGGGIHLELGQEGSGAIGGVLNDNEGGIGITNGNGSVISKLCTSGNGSGGVYLAA